MRISKTALRITSLIIFIVLLLSMGFFILFSQNGDKKTKRVLRVPTQPQSISNSKITPAVEKVNFTQLNGEIIGVNEKQLLFQEEKKDIKTIKYNEFTTRIFTAAVLQSINSQMNLSEFNTWVSSQTLTPLNASEYLSVTGKPAIVVFTGTNRSENPIIVIIKK